MTETAQDPMNSNPETARTPQEGDVTADQVTHSDNLAIQRGATTRSWSIPHLYAAKAYLLAQFRGAGRAAAEADELERMIAAIRYAIEGWRDPEQSS